MRGELLFEVAPPRGIRARLPRPPHRAIDGRGAAQRFCQRRIERCARQVRVVCDLREDPRRVDEAFVEDEVVRGQPAGVETDRLLPRLTVRLGPLREALDVLGRSGYGFTPAVGLPVSRAPEDVQKVMKIVPEARAEGERRWRIRRRGGEQQEDHRNRTSHAV